MFSDPSDNTRMDPNWEFQAPQFVDFTKLGAGEDQVR